MSRPKHCRSYEPAVTLEIVYKPMDLSKASHQIQERVAAEKPTTQIDLLKIAVQERAKLANPVWVLDSNSRRMGIIQKKPYPHQPVKGEKPAQRDNINFKLFEGRAERNVCGL
ncbi:hypothetical protein [Burkholderia sp. Ac-20344]|uniref:hypothetical protein n=1 Tax=Burkholderia sp. Ac-20344 TaxID=2703890 RepID=UPI00197B95A0|nr:hypothetical protein [Burkholderia sp. Ac-20344]MBN3835254.1 hypothetical protein [Burkholderia sp. Ac-20344]